MSLLLVCQVVLQHLGPLHPVERMLTLLLAFGPFVLLAVTIWISRRRNADDNEESSP